MTIDGVVIDAETDRPVDGALVTVCDPDSGYRLREVEATVTGADGAFRLEEVPAGEPIAVRASAPHQEAAQRRPSPEQPGRFEIRLAPAGAIRGIVRDPIGVPVRGANVVARAWDRPEDASDPSARPSAGPLFPPSTRTSADGTYEIGGLDLAKAWSVTATADRFVASETGAALRIPADTRESVRDVALRPPANIEVRAKRPDGSPAAGASIHLSQTGLPSTLTSLDSNGACSLSPLGAGAAVVRVDLSPYPFVARRVDVVPGKDTVVEVEFGGRAVLAGVVVDDLGRPVPHANVTVSWKGDDNARTTTAAADGTFRIEELVSGPATVTASRDGAGLARRREEVSIPSDELRIVLPRLGGVTFRLRAPEGVSPELVAWEAKPSGRDGSMPWTGERMRIVMDADHVALRLSADGVLPVTRTVEVLPGEDTALGDVVMEAAVALQGRVINSAGKPVAGADVVARYDELCTMRDGRADAQTDRSGAFRVGPLSADRVRLSVRAEGFAAGALECELAAGMEPVTVTLYRPTTIRANVRGATLFEVRLQLTEVTSGVPPQRLTVRSEGEFRTHVAPGPWRVDVMRGDEVLATKEVDVAEGGDVSVEFDLSK